MKVQWLLLSAALALPFVASAQDDHSYRCTLGDNVRRLQIFYETGVAVPCEVQYFKDTEAPGGRQVLWRALHESGYCEARAQEFVAKLGQLGWQCQGGRTMPGAEGTDGAAVDDTEVLGAPSP